MMTAAYIIGSAVLLWVLANMIRGAWDAYNEMDDDR